MGGASVHLLDLASALQANGVEVHIVAGGQGILQQKVAQAGLTMTSLPRLLREISPLHDVVACWQLRKVIKAYQPDLVHLHSSKAGLLGRLVCRTMAIPCVFTVHGWAFTEGVSERRRKLYRTLERWVAPLAAKIITVSDYDRELALRYGVSKPSQLITVHNGVPDHAAALTRTTANGSAVKLIMVARFEAPKQQQLVLTIMARLQELPWTLEFVGDGPELDAAKNLSQTLGLTSRVTFSGARSDVAQRLVNSDIFLLFSAWEGLPLTILEAMSCGLPVVASDVGGVKETFDAESGFLIPRGETELDTAESAIRQLITNPDLRQRMGGAARARYLTAFSVQRMLQDTETVYREVLAS